MKKSNSFNDFSPVGINLFKLLWKAKFAIFSMLLGGAITGYFLAYMIKPVYEFSIVIRSPEIGGKYVISPEILVEQFKYGIVQDEIFNKFDSSTMGSLELPRKILEDTHFTKNSQNLRMTINSDDVDKSEHLLLGISNAVISYLDEKYNNRVGPLKYRLENINSRIKIANLDKDYISLALKNKINNSEKNSESEKIFITSLMSTKSYELDNLLSQKYDVEDLLGVDKTHPAKLIHGPNNTAVLQYPIKLKFSLAGGLFGLIIVMLIVFIKALKNTAFAEQSI